MSKILVVDDRRSLRVFYKMDLERDGYVVITAADAAEGLRLCDSESPDLVVLDVRMPGMDDPDAVGRMLGRNPRIPVVLNSGSVSREGSFLGRAADAYVVKSSDTGELRTKIREILESRARATRPSAARPNGRRTAASEPPEPSRTSSERT